VPLAAVLFLHVGDKGDNQPMPKKFHATANGMSLPIEALRVLRERGIYVRPHVTLEHQSLAHRYVLHGVESGGAAGDVGHYVTFAAEDGTPLPCLHPVDSIAVNGVHAVVIAPALVRVEMLRKSRTYELRITLHRLRPETTERRPALETRVLFRGSYGRVELDLAAKDKALAGSVTPTFYSASGEVIDIPEYLLAAMRAATKAVNCCGCSHSHYVEAAQQPTRQAPHALKLARESAIGGELVDHNAEPVAS